MSSADDAADEALREAMQRGDFDNLPGRGKPLKLDDDPYAPPEMRLANQLLKDNDFVPDWIAESRALDRDHERLLRAFADAVRKQHEREQAAAASPTPERARAEALAANQAAEAALRARTEAYNRRALSYNLKVPGGGPYGPAHKPMVPFERALATARRTHDHA
jgi:hypothetical protein